MGQAAPSAAYWTTAPKAVAAAHHVASPVRQHPNQAGADQKGVLGKLKEQEVWLNEYETIDDARRAIGRYVERYHHRPHSGLNYWTPLEVRQIWEDLQNIAA